ncbi:transcriptional regulator [Clostridium botulinum]|uniref:transcriptional regulator n=1 Tax=Clostridium botulinum TaxID=1491 RepID=UPI00224667DC|nr:transcriptional regulator [Clostridium botulinum]UZP01949.1 transcriptional regulator [Clostridium botulinum]UZP05307.1 transcriptional regulator [Clostridium botulinum]UZP08688.1 transcriptional regulator [Clostridium botulinum]
MLSEFGKVTRKLRIDNNELLKDMAVKLNVTTSYLSAVEIGKRNIPTSWRDIIIQKYNLNDNVIKILDEAIYNSQQTLKLKLDKFSTEDKSLMLAFARKFEELQNDEKDNIRKILNRERGE